MRKKHEATLGFLNLPELEFPWALSICCYTGYGSAIASANRFPV